MYVGVFKVLKIFKVGDRPPLNTLKNLEYFKYHIYFGGSRVMKVDALVLRGTGP